MALDEQVSFTSGEVAPSLHARTDLARYQTGLKTCRNFLIHAHGGVSNRPGTVNVGPTRSAAQKARLIPFEFNTEQAYALEFGDQYMRVVKNGGHLLEAAVNITGATQANPVVVTAAAHGYSNGDEVYIAGVVGMTQLNQRRFIVANATADTYELAGIDGTGFDAYVSGGTSSRIYEVATPYLEADLPLLKFTQSADVMTITHPSYEERDLSRVSETNWTLTTISFAPEVDPPTSVTVTPQGTGGSTTYNYKVTAVAEETYEESLAASGSTATGNADLDNTNYNRITWTAPAGAILKYNIYKESNGVYGFIGSCDADETLQFDDKNIGPDLTDSPPKGRDPFVGAGNYPSCVAYHQQRRVFGRSNNKKQTFWTTQIGNIANMNVSTPARADDAITASIASGKVNEIRHIVSLGAMIILTSGGEYVVSGGEGNALTPTNLTVEPQGYRGANDVPPLIIGDTVLFVQRQGRIVRDMGYKFETDGYGGNDLSILSNHLFEGRTVSEWAYAQSPHSIVWTILDNGALLGLTYMREHEVWGWHRHDTDGVFESICSIPEGDEDAVYVIVKRVINGSTVRHIERFHSRYITDVRDAFFVDDGISLDNPIAIEGATQANPVVITSTGHPFSNGAEIDIFDVEGMTELNGGRYTVANATANTYELQGVDGAAYGAYTGGGTAREATLTLGGLWHLEGEEVVILSDGNVVRGKIVSQGQVTLDRKASRVHLGLAYEADLETLPVSFPQASVASRKKRVAAVNVSLLNTRGLWVGPSADKLTEMKQREFEAMGEPTRLFTGIKEIQSYKSWGHDGTVFLRQKDPLPITVLAITPEVEIGG